MKADEAIIALLLERGADKTCCPSEVARRLAGPDEDWRDRMGDVHAATQKMYGDGSVAISWKGKPRAVSDGPYRIALRGASAN